MDFNMLFFGILLNVHTDSKLFDEITGGNLTTSKNMIIKILGSTRILNKILKKKKQATSVSMYHLLFVALPPSTTRGQTLDPVP